MSDYCVVVADSARARLFSLKEAESGAGGPNLIEISDMANTEAELAGRELWSDTNTGRNAAPDSGAHSYDDHRNRHREEIERRFAKEVAAAVAAAVGREKASRVVVAAEARMLGQLREAMKLPATVQISEVPKNLSKLSPQELHGHLAADNALPVRRSPA